MQPQTTKQNYTLYFLLLLAAAAGLRIYQLDFQSLWIDEVNSMVQARPDLSFGDTYRGLSMDLQPPLYFYLLKIFFSLFGYTTFVLRLFSALAGVAGVGAIYLLGKEMHGKRAGVLAAALLTFNYFHIYYSQEARPYSFLLLFTVLSFHSLLRFIKTPSPRKALVYAIMSSLMLYGHAFGIILLFSQYLLLLVCVISLEHARWRFFRLCILAGLCTALLYLPALPLFLSAAGIRSFWIPLPAADVFTQLLAEFFGRSETVLAVVYLLLLYYFFYVFTTRGGSNFTEGLRTGKAGPIFVVLSFWIVCGLVVPLVRSHLQVPMIVSRYLIGLLPAVLLMLSIALAEINRSAVRAVLLAAFLLFSATDVFVVKNYYHKVSKSQLREITAYIRQNHQASEPIVTDLWWHYDYFLGKATYRIPEMRPSEYIDLLMAGKEPKGSFWYSSGHTFKFDQLPEPQRKYLDEHYSIDQKLELTDAWAIHFVPKQTSEAFQLDVANFQPFGSGSGAYIFLYADTLTTSPPFQLAAGWYELHVLGCSEPAEPIHGINAHISIYLNGNRAGGMFLRPGPSPAPHRLLLKVPAAGALQLGVAFDNDLTQGEKDRNALVYSLRLLKIQSSGG